MNITLSNQVVLVTGAGRGIGREIALFAARAGAHAILVARSGDQLEHVAAAIEHASGSSTVAPADVTDFQVMSDLVKRIIAEHGRIDVLVNNAGTNHIGPLVMSREDDWRRVYELNVFAVFHLTKLVLKPMIRAKSGRIINIASVAGQMGARLNTAYSSSKAAILGFTRSLALETARQGITVNAVCPWHVDTQLTRTSMGTRGKMFGTDADEHLANIVKQSTQGRAVEATEVAALTVFLMSKEASAITGQCLNVCGGNAIG